MTKDFFALQTYLKDKSLPEGLEIHCEKCHIVIPSDAPRPEGGDCERIMRAKLTPFDQREHATAAGRHVMAVAAWSLIFHQELKDDSHPAASQYLLAHRTNRKLHYAKSAVRAALQPEHIEAESQKHNGRDAWLYR